MIQVNPILAWNIFDGMKKTNNENWIEKCSEKYDDKFCFNNIKIRLTTVLSLQILIYSCPLPSAFCLLPAAESCMQAYLGHFISSLTNIALHT